MILLKSLVGIGIYSMPLAVSMMGLASGIFGTVFTAFICTHCVFMLLRNTYTLCQKMKRPLMTFPEVGEAACLNGELNVHLSCTTK